MNFSFWLFIFCQLNRFRNNSFSLLPVFEHEILCNNIKISQSVFLSSILSTTDLTVIYGYLFWNNIMV